MTPMRRLSVFLAVALAVLLLLRYLPSGNSGGDFHDRPRLAHDDAGVWAAFQSTPASDEPSQYEIRRYDRQTEAWLNRGRFNGLLAGLAENEGRLWVATEDGALTRVDEPEEPLALPDNRWRFIDLAWLDGGIVALNYMNDSLTILRPDGDRSWGREEIVVENAGGVDKARLIVVGATPHVIWRSRNDDLSAGSLCHMIRENGQWRELPSLPFGGGVAFAAFVDGGALRLAVRQNDALGRDVPAKFTFLTWERTAWTAGKPPPERTLVRLENAYDFAVGRDRGFYSWLLTGPDGAVAITGSGDDRRSVAALAPGFGEAGPGWSVGFVVFFSLLMALLLARTCRKSRQISLLFPGRPADLMSRAVAIFLDGLIVSLGVVAYHLAAGDLNLYEEFLTLGMMNQAFWINMAALILFCFALEARYGRTPGKWLMGIRVRSAGGGAAGVLQAASRNLFRAVDMAPLIFPGLIGAVATMLNRRRQRIGDIMGGTVVRRHAPTGRRLYLLASSSPRRRELLQALGVRFDVYNPDIHEDGIVGPTPAETARLLADAKAGAAYANAQYANAIIIAADTMVTIDNEVLGKPKDEEDAKRMLTLLSGRTHKVLTGVVVWDTATGQKLSDVEETDVEFRPLAEGEIDRYVGSGDPLDKAGAYGIQSGYLVKQIRGSLSNVAGLPMEMVQDLLRRLDS